MKYRTVIEIICDDTDAENALHTAGEYLRGNVDCGVHMNCSTTSFNFHLFKNIMISGLIVLSIASAFVYRIGSVEGKINNNNMVQFNNTQ